MSASALQKFNDRYLDGLDFCKAVYALFEDIRTSEDGPTRLRMRPSEIEKRLLEELFPIARWVQLHYKAGRYISIKWVSGGQNFDAVVEQSGWLVECELYPSNFHLEITCAMHPKDYLRREMLEFKGHSFSIEGLYRDENGEANSQPVGYNGDEFIEIFANILVEQINKKAKKNYPEGSLLIVKCTMNSYYFRSEWERMISIVEEKLPSHGFSEIFVYDDVQEELHHTFYARKA